MLFLSEINLYRATEEIEIAPELILKETSVRLADILRKVAEESERRRLGRKLSHILDLDILTLPCRRRIIVNLLKHHLIELRSRNLS